MPARAIAFVCLGPSIHLLARLNRQFTSWGHDDFRSVRTAQTHIPAYTEACCELEKYQQTFEPPYASRPASGFLLVSFSKVTRHLLRLVATTLLAESLPNNANDYSFAILAVSR